MAVEFPFLGPDEAERVSDVSAQKTVNFYPHFPAPGAKNKMVLYSCPGLKQFGQTGGITRSPQGVIFDGNAYFVVDDKLKEVSTTGTVTDVGTLNTSGGTCALVAGRNSLLIVDGTDGYTYDGSFFIDSLNDHARSGNDLVTNGTFDTDSDWTKGTGWTISGGTATCDGSQGSASDLAQSISVTDGDDYVLQFTVSGYNAGTLTPKVAGGSGTAVSSDGTYIQTITASSGSNLEFEADSDFEGSIDDVTLYARGEFQSDATSCTYLDGYFIVNSGDRFYISAIEDPTSWAALDFATAESDPDNIVAVIANYKDLYLLGERTTQVAYNSGNQLFPFEFYPGGTTEYGCIARASATQSPFGLFWLATTAYGGVQVIQVQKFESKPVSGGQHGIDWELSQLGTVNDAIAWLYKYGEYTWYHITFPSEGRSWEYCIETQTWIERESFTDYVSIGRYRGAGHVFFDERQLIADYSNGKLYELDFDSYDEDGEILKRLRRAQAVDENQYRMIHRKIELEIESGKGLVTGQGSDPQMMLRYSDDGGYQWSSEIWAGMGKIGEYRRRALWRNLGISRERIYEVSVTDPVPVTLTRALGNFQRCSF